MHNRRRICPGLAFAERELWLAISRLLWSYDFYPAPGKPTAIEEYEGSVGKAPLPFELLLIPRHSQVETVMKEEAVDLL